MDLLDPIGWVGAYGYYFFFVAPMLTVMWGYRTTELAETPNWRDWIGWMAVLNCCGIIVYFLVRRFLQNREQTSRSTWCFRHNSLIHVMAAALPLTALVQILIYARFGGIWGFMETFSAHDKAFDGMGWQFLIAESFPCLLAIFILVYKRQTLKQAPWTAIALLIAAFFITKLVFGGLRGSRSNTIWAIFWLVGAIHAWIKPVPRRFLMIGVRMRCNPLPGEREEHSTRLCSETWLDLRFRLTSFTDSLPSATTITPVALHILAR
jgi:hypothetical protein